MCEIGYGESPSITMTPTKDLPIFEWRKGKRHWLRVSGVCLLKLVIITLGKFLPGSIHRPLPLLPQNPRVPRTTHVSRYSSSPFPLVR
jgi:hypothetical protein